MHVLKFRVVILFLLLSQSCNLNSKKHTLNKIVVAGDYPKADKFLDKNHKAKANGRNKLLYYIDRGLVAYLNQDYEKSNEFFNIADNIHEDQVKTAGDILLKYTVNSSLTNYTAEDHEVILIHYYKILNYLALNQIDEALVECRRLDVELCCLADKYSDPKSYFRDAFAHILMGIVYQAANDFNNAFIAYRNAIEIFEHPDFVKYFRFDIPEQLKKDIIFVAYKTYDYDNVNLYKKKFDLMDYRPENEGKNCGELVCFWNNGTCPKKKDYVIWFGISRIGNNMIFSNSKLHLFFSFPVDDSIEFDFHSLCVAFPKYKRSFSIVNGGFLDINEERYKLEKIENVNRVARKLLKNRMNYELGQMLLRLAIKKSGEYLLRNFNNELGMLLGIFNSLSEEADTRQCENMPFEIFYSRVKLKEGEYTIKLVPNFRNQLTYDLYDKFDKQNTNEKIFIKKDKTVFVQFNTPCGSY